MLIKDLLRSLDLGSSVAEFDADLKTYFVETETFRAVITGNVDIIAGDKGTGKTALYKVLRDRYREFQELENVEILPAFNPAGNPVFQRLGQLPPLNEGQYTTIWKSYLLSLVGNWLLEIFADAPTERMQRLNDVLTKVGLRSSDDSAQTIFSKLVNLISKLINPKSAQVALSVTEAGMPVITPKIEFGGDAKPGEKAEIIPHEDALRELNACLTELGLTVWVVLDRLDEAFQGYPAVERPALRALLRTYLDLLDFDRVRLKLFVRKDLFRKVVQGGFVNLTHVNAKRLDIVWDEEDLLALLCRRVRRNTDFIDTLGATGRSDQELFSIVFPAQVDAGPRKPTTWTWMMSRIRDGNGIKPPRNLIDLAKKSQEAQQRAEERAARVHAPGTPLIESDAIRKALQRLSEDRVNDTLLAEAADLAPLIERFRDGKAEHNVTSLARVLDVAEADVRTAVKPLVELGFLEEIGESFKVPILYRDGMQITQGKAFSVEAGAANDDE
jgi:hypothetical protein